jgi:hypothetical protein
MTPNFPFTYTGFQRSRYSSLFTSGLAIDIAGLPIDTDEMKVAFINSPNFEFYKNAAGAHGFGVIKNSPWILVADLGSPALEKYHTKEGYVDIYNIFDSLYDKTYIYDIQYIKTILYNNYNVIADRFTYERNIDICNGKLLIGETPRETVSIVEFDRLFPNDFWIELYNNIRNMEMGMVFANSDVKNFTYRAKKIEKTFDISRGIGYINEQYRSVYKSMPGGLNDELRRQRKREREEKLELED